MTTLSAVADAANAVRNITPVATMAYIDEIQLWLQRPLRRAHLERLASQCDSLHHLRTEKRWQHATTYVQRLQLRRPRREALEFLSMGDDVLINRLDLALDWIFDDPWQCDDAHELFLRYRVKRWHGRQEQTSYRGVTNYTAHRAAPTNFVSYADRPSRITGAVYCVHLEWRLNGVRALRRAGIAAVRDLFRIDPQSFWRQRLLLRAVDCRTLGRHYQNHVMGASRRTPRLKRFGRNGSLVYDYDLRLGSMLVRTAGSTDNYTRGTTQAVIDEYRDRLDLARCLKELPVEHLLPLSSIYDYGASPTNRNPSHSRETIFSAEPPR